MKLVRLLSVIIALGLVSACSRIYLNPTSPTDGYQYSNTQSNAKVEFRVTGNASSVRVRYTNERDGLVQTVTTLPFFATFNSNSPSLFLSLEVTPISFSQLIQFPFTSAQIFVNGDLFREVTSNDYLLYTISVNGTWRK